VSISELSSQLRQGAISPVEVVATCLERIEQLNPRLNAFITVLANEALEAAGQAAEEIAAGRWRGPLHGIPVGVKDFFDTAGIRTTAAFAPFEKRVPDRDAAVVTQLKKAGAIIVGKTNMHTLGMGTTGLESHFGPVQNPWHADFIPGGSSSGSAAAVAAGMCYATVDTDAIGSCRLPSACCGVVGFKGTYGSIDLTGILGDQPPPDETIRWLAHAGITTRRVEDTASVLAVLATQPSESIAVGRIGIATNVRAQGEVAEAFEASVEVIRRLGCEVRQSAAPLHDLRTGVGQIERDRAAIAERTFKDIDLLLLPTTPEPTLPVAAARTNPLALSPENTAFANYYGLPAISVPCGSDRRGLPLAVQIVGRPGHDASVLHLAAKYQHATSPLRAPDPE
jgi:aspartyl-tRNA(Asn)/glutamyl-tRNA(Gln) amidotransferase subunit A